MSRILVKLDIKKDAWNWWEACNKISHGVDWKKQISPYLRRKIVGRTQKQAYIFLLPYLKRLYKQEDIKAEIKTLQQGFNKKQVKLFSTMERLTKHKIYRDNFICFLTTFPRFPYDYENGYVWIFYKNNLDFQLSIFIHELLHFQFFAYYGDKAWDILGPKKYQHLKEAMTVILNKEFKHIGSIKDEGYKIHKALRKKLLKIWQERQDFDLFINRGIKTTKFFKI